MGNSGPPPIRAFFRICKRARKAFRARPDISLLLLARRNHACSGRADRLAAGPGRFAALSRDMQASFARGKATADIGRPALGAADRHGSSHRESRPRARLARNGPLCANTRSGRRTLSLGGYDAFTQGYTGKLSHRRRCRRCPTGRNRRCPGRRSLPGDEPASFVAGPARSSRSGLSPSRPFARCFGTEIVKKFKGQIAPGSASGWTFPCRGTRKACVRSDPRRGTVISCAKAIPHARGWLQFQWVKAPLPSQLNLRPRTSNLVPVGTTSQVSPLVAIFTQGESLILFEVSSRTRF